jgi:peroxiredoxin
MRRTSSRGRRWCVWLLAALVPGMSIAMAADDEPAKGGAGVLELRVVNSLTDQPLQGVEIHTQIHSVTSDLLTDGDGRCFVRIPGQKPRFVGVWAKKDGYVPVSVSWDQEGAKVPAEYTLPLEPGTTIGGIIQNEEGKPVAGATVFLLVPGNDNRDAPRPRASLWDHPVKTDEKGRWRCDLLPAKLDDVWIRLSHPDYASDTSYGATPKPTMDRLRDRTGVMVLKKGITVAGRVLAADGAPVKGARVSQGTDRWGTHYPDTFTNDNGEFHFANGAAGEMVLTVQARKHAPDLKRVNVSRSMAPVEFRLEPARTIRGRLVDGEGNPVAGAFVAADTWRGCRSIEFRVNTGNDGRFEWNDAPSDPVLFDMGGAGFMSVRHKSLAAGDGDATITLLRPLRVKGAVVDAATGKPINTFTVVPGIRFDNQPNPYWQRRDAKPARDGRYELSFAEPRPEHLVRIEAEGYLPAVSRAIKDGEGAVTIDFKLKKGEGVAGIVLGADDQPRVGVEAALVLPGHSCRIENGRVPDRSDVVVVETDSDGKFRFPPQEGAYSVVVIGDEGYAFRSQEKLAAEPKVKLEPWGRIEGTVRIGSKPGAGERVHLSIDGSGSGTTPLPYFDYNATADADGRYTIERVPPGDVSVTRSIRLSARSTAYSHGKSIFVKPGETARVDLGGTGRPVAGRLVAPGKSDVDFSRSFSSLSLKLPEINAPKGLTDEERTAWYKAWSESPEGKARRLASRNYSVKIEGDGRFRIDDVPAGTYDLTISVQRPLPDNRKGYDVLGTLRHTFTVPEMPGGRSDEMLDLGTLELKIHKRIDVGEAAPEFRVETLDGKPLRLADYRGKVVLLDFWRTGSGPSIETIRHLKAVHSAFGKDPRFVMIGLCLDASKDGPRRFVETNQIGWVQGFPGASGAAKLREDFGLLGIPSTWLIGPDGKVIAKDLQGQNIKNAVAKALDEST